MANHLVNFQHKQPAAKDWTQKSEIVFISGDDNKKQGKEYKDFLLSILDIDKKEIVIFNSITRL
jgi:hypothetical protein